MYIHFCYKEGQLIYTIFDLTDNYTLQEEHSDLLIMVVSEKCFKVQSEFYVQSTTEKLSHS